MLTIIIGATLGVVAGIINVVTRNINAILAKKIGLLESTFFNYVTGISLAFFVLILSGEISGFSFKAASTIPWGAYLGGLLGVVVVVTASSFVTPKISAFYMTILMFIGQLFTGIIIDYAIEGAFHKEKIIGGAFVVLGLVITLKADSKKKKVLTE